MNESAPRIDVTDILSRTDKVLVTGASGFIGRHLIARLRAMGKTVVPVSRGDGIDIVRDSLPLDGVGHVFHAAARIGVPMAWRDPVEFLNANTFGTVRVLDQCRIRGCGMTFVGAYIYGIPERLPIAETDRINANNPYALSKFLAEQACAFYAEYYGVRVSILRLFNIYGPGQNEELLIPFIVRQIIDSACEIVEVMDLEPKRDYVHVTDVVDAILRSTCAAPGAVFNVGSGEAISVEEIIRLANKVAGTNKPYRDRGSRRRNEIDNTIADIRYIRDQIGWVPRIDFETGLVSVIDDMRLRCAA